MVDADFAIGSWWRASAGAFSFKDQHSKFLKSGNFYTSAVIRKSGCALHLPIK